MFCQPDSCLITGTWKKFWYNATATTEVVQLHWQPILMTDSTEHYRYTCTLPSRASSKRGNRHFRPFNPQSAIHLSNLALMFGYRLRPRKRSWVAGRQDDRIVVCMTGVCRGSTALEYSLPRTRGASGGAIIPFVRLQPYLAPYRPRTGCRRWRRRQQHMVGW